MFFVWSVDCPNLPRKIRQKGEYPEVCMTQVVIRAIRMGIEKQCNTTFHAFLILSTMNSLNRKIMAQFCLDFTAHLLISLCDVVQVCWSRSRGRAAVRRGWGCTTLTSRQSEASPAPTHARTRPTTGAGTASTSRRRLTATSPGAGSTGHSPSLPSSRPGTTNRVQSYCFGLLHDIPWHWLLYVEKRKRRQRTNMMLKEKSKEQTCLVQIN
jgi:hypothetical protein